MNQRARAVISDEMVLLDLNLPVMSGLETLDRLTQQCPDVPVIIVSGSGTMTDGWRSCLWR